MPSGASGAQLTRQLGIAISCIPTSMCFADSIVLHVRGPEWPAKWIGGSVLRPNIGVTRTASSIMESVLFFDSTHFLRRTGFTSPENALGR